MEIHKILVCDLNGNTIVELTPNTPIEIDNGDIGGFRKDLRDAFVDNFTNKFGGWPDREIKFIILE